MGTKRADGFVQVSCIEHHWRGAVEAVSVEKVARNRILTKLFSFSVWSVASAKLYMVH